MMGIQTIADATGTAEAKTTLSAIKDRNLVDKVTSLVFDTAFSNKGWKKQATKLLKGLLQRK